VTGAPNWIESAHHQHWLRGQTETLLEFYRRHAMDRDGGGFWWLGERGEPRPEQGKPLWLTARLTHGFALGSLLGRPGSAALVEHGLAALRSGPFRDQAHGGWFWSIGASADATKQAYGHAFVLLAASTATLAGFDGRGVLDDALQLLLDRFWDEEAGMFVETWDRSFERLDPYRGQNANMHLVEALLAAAEATADTALVSRAERIAARLIREVTAARQWRLPEHFDADWRVDPRYNEDDPEHPFRPFGSSIGHELEWARLLLQLDAASARPQPWRLDAARSLFARAIADGWDAQRTGFAYSTDADGRILNPDRYHWVTCEAIGAAVALHRATGDPRYAAWYRTFWEHAVEFVIDPAGTGWRHQLDEHNRPRGGVWSGRPDLYHALQATLYARVPSGGSIAAGLLG
jgi:sulfoquinovose isomerase